jgi:O-antigen/teichoic acid export membrane protein
MTFSFQSLRDLWRFGFNVTGDRSVHFLTERLDYLIIGRCLTPAALGFYSVGYRIIDFLTSSLWMTVNRVAFSTFSLVQDEHERLRRGFTKSLTYLSLIVFPVFVGLAIVASELVGVVFGQKWAAAVSPVQILCIMAVITSISVAVGALFRSKGRPDIELKLSLVKLALLVIGLLIGVQFGTVGAAAGVSAVAAIIWLPRQMLANRLIGLRMRDYFASLRPAAFGSLVMALTLLAFRYTVGSLLTLPDIGLLISSVLLGAVTYFITLKVVRTQALDEMIGLALDMVRPYARLVMARMGLRKKEAPRFAEPAHGEDL